jgi:EmrB/QacA subfamily drug resistance transporter
MLFALCVALFVTMLDTTIVTVALPDLQQHSKVSVSDLQWVVNGYLVVFTALMLTGGVLADRLGRRNILLLGLVIFAVGSLVAATTHPGGGWDGLRIGRLVQGLGAALSEPATLAVIRNEYADDRERARALGIWAAVSGVALALGPVLGGLLVEIGGWRAVFVANVPLALAALLVAGTEVPESRDERGRPFDVPALALGGIIVVGLSWALIQGQTDGFGAPSVIAGFTAAAVATVGFALVERMGRDPLLPRDLFADHRVTAGVLAALAASFAVFAVFFFVTLDLQAIGSESAAATAAAYLPMTVAMVLAAVGAGRWTARRGTTPPLVTGLLLAAGGLLVAETQLGLHPKAGPVAAALIVVGLGLGLTLAPATAAVLRGVSPQRAGLGAAVVNEGRQVGGLLAVAVLGAITVGRLDGVLNAKLRQIGVPGFYRDQIFFYVTHGGSRDQGSVGAARGLFGPIVDQVIDASERAFVSGLHVALVAAAGVLAGTALVVIAAEALHRRRRSDAAVS